MNSKYRNLLWLVPIAILVIAAVPSFNDFNANQFGTTGYRVSIKSGVLVTNPVIRADGTLGIAGQALLSTGAGVGWSNVLSDGSILLNLTISTLSSTYQTSGSLTVTNPITNLSLTANTVLRADGNKAISSVPNGTGVLTNDGAGGFSWVSLQPFVESLVVWPVQGSNTVLTTNGMAVTVNALTDTNVVAAIAADAVDLSAYQLGDTGLTNFANLADGAGRLTNNGAGVFGWDNSAMGIAGADVLTMINTNAVWTNDAGSIRPVAIVVENSLFLSTNAGRASTFANGSQFIGDSAGELAESASGSQFIGHFAGAGATFASGSSFIGQFAGLGATDSSDSQFIGDSSGFRAQYANRSQFVGKSSGYESTNAFNSVFIGDLSGYQAFEASESLFLGYYSGFRMTNANNSIFLGKYSGTNRANTLWIDTQASVGGGSYIPLIYGEFDNRLLRFNGFLEVTNLTEGSIVGVGASGRLINTNVLQVLSNATITVENITVNNSITVLTNVTAKTINVENIYVTNGTVFKEHTWTGATNELYVGSTNRYTYTAYTPCAVTNLVRLISGFGNSALLSITNASDSNITFTVHSPIRIPYGETTRTYTITNGDVFAGSFDYGTHGMLYVPRGFFSP